MLKRARRSFAAGDPASVEVGKTSLRRAANLGNSRAMVLLANHLSAGSHGETLDVAAAFRWYRKAADRGNGEAQFKLAMAHVSGFHVAKDLELARTWLKRAQRNGYPLAGAVLEQLAPKQ